MRGVDGAGKVRGEVRSASNFEDPSLEPVLSTAFNGGDSC